MHGEKEQRCFEKVKEYLSDENIKAYFGCLKTDFDEINYAIKNAISNKNESEFPDFVFNNGFIEHFQITSSEENQKKGSEHIKKENIFKANVQKESNELKEEWSNNENSNIKSKTWAMIFPKHSHKFIMKSMINNWKSHMDSFQKYTGNKDISIFMIEYTDSALEMYENVYKNWIDGMSNGDIREPEHLKTYRLTRDEELLKFIYKYKDSINYVIFIYDSECEVIKLENIPYILKLMPWKYVIAPHIGTTLISSLYRL